MSTRPDHRGTAAPPPSPPARPPRRSRRRRWLLLAAGASVLLVGGLVVADAVMRADADDRTDAEPVACIDEDFSIELGPPEAVVVEAPWFYEIRTTGSVTNTGDVPVRFVSLWVHLANGYDLVSDFAGSSLDGVELAPGASYDVTASLQSLFPSGLPDAAWPTEIESATPEWQPADNGTRC